MQRLGGRRKASDRVGNKILKRMKSIQSERLLTIQGGGDACSATLTGMATFATVAAGAGPIGWALAITVGVTALGLFAAGACDS